MNQILPAISIEEALPLLAKPFSPNQVQFKIQVNPKDESGAALTNVYVDARTVAQRFNIVCGGNWSHQYGQAADKFITCRITAFDVHHEDVGTGGNSMDGDNMIKELRSDALKRAAVHFGVGASLYEMPNQVSWIRGDQLKKRGNKWEISPKGDADLRVAYANAMKQWIATYRQDFQALTGFAGSLTPDATVNEKAS